MADDPRRRLGALGERLAADHLAALGYEVLERNFRTRFGELDLVARSDRCLVFGEGKARLGGDAPGPFGPLVSVGRRKRVRVRRMAGQWLHERGGGPGAPGTRFDVVGVTVDREGRLVSLEHVEGAF